MKVLQQIFTLATLLTISHFSYAQCIGGNVMTEDGGQVVYTCPSDGIDDVISFRHENASDPETSFRYVVTDSDYNILGLPPANSVNFDGAGTGVCLVWGLAYTGDFLGQGGDNVFSTQFSTGCWNLSKTAVRVVRSQPDGGTVALSTGATEIELCTTDGYDNALWYTHENESPASYRYIVTDDNNMVLAVLPANNQNFEGVPVGVCRVWGLSYTGSLMVGAGDDLTASNLASSCFDLSDNYVTVTRTDVDGGTVSTADGDLEVFTIAGDGNSDPINFAHISNSEAGYAYIVTDSNNKIIGTPPGNTVDFEGAGEGVCLVWGVSYTGELRYLLGGTLGDFALSTDCFNVSENAVRVTRSAAPAPSNFQVSTTAATSKVVSLAPNPAADVMEIRIQATIPTIDASILVFDALGQRVLAEQLSLVAGENSHQLYIQRLAPGTYTLQVHTGGKTSNETFVKL